LQISIPCPECGNQSLHLSRPRRTEEKLLHTFTPFRICRCNFCNWRGKFTIFKIWGDRLTLVTALSAIGLLAGGLLLTRILAS